MANRTVDLRIDVLFFPRLLGKILLPLLALRFPIQLRHKLDRTKMFVGIPVAVDAPCHRKLFMLVDRFHLVDSTMATLAANARIDVSRVIEVNELRQVVNPLPGNAAARIPALMDRRQLLAVGMDRRHRSDTLRIGRTVAVDAGCRRRHRRMRRIKDGIVTVATIHLQLASVNGMTEGNRLLGLVTDVQCLGVGNQATHGAGKYRTRSTRNRKHDQ